MRQEGRDPVRNIPMIDYGYGMRTLGLGTLLLLAFSGCAHDKNAAAGDKTAAAPTENAAIVLRHECCAQCAGAAKRDPAGMDLSGKDCTSYAGDFNGQPGVDVRCVAHFGQQPTTVGACWQEQPELK